MVLELKTVSTLLNVYDMPESLHFYRDLLGFEVISHSPVLPEGHFHWCMLRRGEAELMLNTAFEHNSERPSVRDEASMKAHADVCLYIGCPDVDGAYAELLARGISAKAPVNTWYGARQTYFRDPDGYGLCFQWAAPAA